MSSFSESFYKITRERRKKYETVMRLKRDTQRTQRDQKKKKIYICDSQAAANYRNS